MLCIRLVSAINENRCQSAVQIRKERIWWEEEMYVPNEIFLYAYVSLNQ
jgi:hypothetical protein